MSILARFTTTPSVTIEQYDESLRRLRSRAPTGPRTAWSNTSLTSGGNSGQRDLDTREQLRRSVSGPCRCWPRSASSLSVSRRSSVHNITPR